MAAHVGDPSLSGTSEKHRSVDEAPEQVAQGDKSQNDLRGHARVERLERQFAMIFDVAVHGLIIFGALEIEV